MRPLFKIISKWTILSQIIFNNNLVIGDSVTIGVLIKTSIL